MFQRVIKENIDTGVATEKSVAKQVYQKKIEDGKLVLQGRNVRLVEIANTEEDREKYISIMNQYLTYVKENYVNDLEIEKVDISLCFKEECSNRDEKKLPLFFAYRNDGKLLGTIGSTGVLKLKDDKKNVVFNCFSCRFVCVAKYSNLIGKAGTEALTMFPLFAKDEGSFLYFDAYQCRKLRDLWFHYSELHHFLFIGTKIINHIYFTNPVGLDVFISDDVAEFSKELLSKLS